MIPRLTYLLHGQRPSLLLFALISILLVAGCSSTAPTEEERQAHTYAKALKRYHFSLFNTRSDGLRCKAEWRKAPPLEPDLWARIGKHYALPDNNNERIVTERNWYVNHPTYLNRMSGRASRYLYYVAQELESRQLPGELALLPIVESAYNPFALSRSQASGLWQFIPSTAKHLKMDMNWWYDARRDIPVSTDTALDYLVFLRDHYDGDWLKALAAYNAGWGTIDRAVEKNRARGLPTDYWSLDVPDETRAYVPKLLALAQISKDPVKYGVNWAYIPNLPYFAEVSLNSQLDITLAADMAGVSSDELYLLNPGISRWATPPGGSYRMLVPVDQANEFQERIASLGAEQRLQMSDFSQQRAATGNPMVQEMERKAVASAPVSPPAGGRSYTVKKGDTIWSVARKEGVTPDALRKLNKLPANEPLKLGHKLALPANGKTVVASNKATSPGKATEKTTKATASRTTAASKATVASKTGKTPATSKTAYKVQSGDTLMAIARKHGIAVDDIVHWNSLDKKKAALKPGQTLTLYLSQNGKP